MKSYLIKVDESSIDLNIMNVKVFISFDLQKKLMRFLPNNLLQFSHSARHERYVLKWRPLWALFANQLSNLRKCVPCWHLSRNLSWSRLLTILFSGSQLSCLPHVCSLAAIGGLLLLLWDQFSVDAFKSVLKVQKFLLEGKNIRTTFNCFRILKFPALFSVLIRWKKGREISKPGKYLFPSLKVCEMLLWQFQAWLYKLFGKFAVKERKI